ncbi:MAG: 4-hydroxyphenylpyruvate dioxygenase [Deltaproteobacteria bacterium]|nr:4-hydroxyphenylpyruvate dioxygenase [Deltaproteobacteria bacterium]
MANTVGIRGYDFVEFFVGSGKMTAYWHMRAMGFEAKAYMGPETGCRDRNSYLLTKNNLKFVITTSCDPGTHEITSFLERHGDGVKRWGFEVDDVTKAFQFAREHGAIPVHRPYKIEDENGYVEKAAIRIYDDAEIVFVNYDNYKGLFQPGFKEPVQKMEISSQDTGLNNIDHIVGNVREDEMNFWESYFNKALDFETIIHFGPGDISTKYSALLSKVVRSKDDVIKNPINEPYEGVRKSQIEEYIEQFHGTGVQHIAIATPDIIKSIRAMRANGVEFLSVPKTYYDALREKNKESGLIEENIDDLEELGILCDVERGGTGYLLQLFTKPISDRPTFFYEIIQRKHGAIGFGQGNFQALFESIERDQEKRGNL